MITENWVREKQETKTPGLNQSISKIDAMRPLMDAPSGNALGDTGSTDNLITKPPIHLLNLVKLLTWQLIVLISYKVYPTVEIFNPVKKLSDHGFSRKMFAMLRNNHLYIQLAYHINP